MDSETENSNMELIKDYEAIRLLVNIYMIKTLKKPQKPVNQVKFMEDVLEEFSSRNYEYSLKEILTTWKHLLELYHYYKENFENDIAKETWEYFELMDTCFDETMDTSEKFVDPDSTIYLIDCMSEHRETLMKEGLTMDVLLDVENEFRKSGNNEINQKDIYSQWNNLKKMYYDYRHSGHRKPNGLDLFLEGMRLFYQEDERQKYANALKRKTEESDQSEKRLHYTES